MANNQEILTYFNYAIYTVNFLTIIGSLLSFLIFSRKAFERSTIGIYCKSVAIYDLFVIFNLSVGIASIVMKSRSLILVIEVVCKITSFLLSTFSPMSAWILVAFSLDQLITVSLTKRFLFFKKKSFQYTILIGLFIFHCLIYSPVPYLSGLHNITTSENSSLTTCGNNSIVFPIIILFEGFILPLVILFILTVIIIRYLAMSRSKINIVPRLKSSESLRNVSSAANMKNHRRVNDLKYAFNSVILNIIHIVFSSPLYILGSLPISALDYELVNIIGYLLFSLNFALHFGVHFCVNSIFRNEFLILIRIRQH